MKARILVLVLIISVFIGYGQNKVENNEIKVDTLFTGTIKFKDWKEANVKVLLYSSSHRIDSIFFIGIADKKRVRKLVTISEIKTNKEKIISIDEYVDDLIKISFSKNFNEKGGVIFLDAKFSRGDQRVESFLISNKLGSYNSYLRKITIENTIKHLEINLEAFFFFFITVDSYKVYGFNEFLLYEEKEN